MYHYLFSVLENFPVKLQAAIKELQQVQRRRKNKKLKRREIIGTGTIKKLNAECLKNFVKRTLV
jgi:hypothetical protein